MSRALCLLGLAALVAVGLTQLSIGEDVVSSEATPQMPSPPTPSPVEPGEGAFRSPHAWGKGLGMRGFCRSHDPLGDAVPVSLLIRNDGDDDDRLLGGSTPVARCVEFHRTRLVDGRREMQTMPDGLAISANETLILEPGGSHLMLFGLQADLVQGESFPFTLHFAHAGEVTVSVRVRRRVDAAGVTPFPPVVVGDLSVSLASAPPASAGTPTP